MAWTLAIETGGTFTDLFVLGPDGQTYTDKIPSTPSAPERAAEAAFTRARELAEFEAAAVDRLLHGSTVAVNALLERRALPPALITTRGFRDMLFIGRQEKLHIYDMAYRKPDPFTERAMVYELEERIGPDGQVIKVIDPEEAAALVDRVVAETGCKTIAVCFLHAYVNPAHERALADIVATRHDEVEVVLSSTVCPVHREYERASTTVINAYVHPVVDRYLARFAETMAAAGCGAEPLIMQANGGVLPVPATRRRPAGLYLSGPSAAVSGAASLARAGAQSNLITLDVGGTSTDICLVTDGEVHETGHGGNFGRVQGQPLNMVMTDIVTIGAGGGSIAWVDDGGMLRVGPKSAGADPGPACYNRGGDRFTLTDAMLCLGLLADGATLPGGIVLSRSAAASTAATLQSALDLDLNELADAVYRVAVANMAEAIRSVTVRRGFDPRDYALFACGGAGPLVAAALAEELEVHQVVVPADPGVFSAFGLTASGLRMDFARAPDFDPAAPPDAATFDQHLDELCDEADAAFRAAGQSVEGLRYSFTADVRYVGQGFELRVPFERAGSRDSGISHVADCFHTLHAQRYGHAFEDQAVEITALRLTASTPRLTDRLIWRSGSAHQDEGERQVWCGDAMVQARYQDRSALKNLDVAHGPALIVEPTTTTWLPPGWIARSDELGLLQIECRKESA